MPWTSCQSFTVIFSYSCVNLFLSVTLVQSLLYLRWIIGGVMVFAGRARRHFRLSNLISIICVQIYKLLKWLLARHNIFEIFIHWICLYHIFYFGLCNNLALYLLDFETFQFVILSIFVFRFIMQALIDKFSWLLKSLGLLWRLLLFLVVHYFDRDATGGWNILRWLYIEYVIAGGSRVVIFLITDWRMGASRCFTLVLLIHQS